MSISWSSNVPGPGEIGVDRRLAQYYLERINEPSREVTGLSLWLSGGTEPLVRWYVNGDTDEFSETVATVLARYDLKTALDNNLFPQQPYGGSAVALS